MKMTRLVFTKPSLPEKSKLIIKKWNIIFGSTWAIIVISQTVRTSTQFYTCLIIFHEIISVVRDNELFQVPMGGV